MDTLVRLICGIAVGLLGGFAVSRFIETISSAAASDLLNAVSVIGQ